MPGTTAAPAAHDASSATTVSARYLVQAAADPGMLPRLLEPFSKLGAVPSRVHASRESGDGSAMSIDLRIAGVTPRMAELIDNALSRVVGVEHVIAAFEAE